MWWRCSTTSRQALVCLPVDPISGSRVAERRPSATARPETLWDSPARDGARDRRWPKPVDLEKRVKRYWKRLRPGAVKAGRLVGFFAFACPSGPWAAIERPRVNIISRLCEVLKALEQRSKSHGRS